MGAKTVHALAADRDASGLLHPDTGTFFFPRHDTQWVGGLASADVFANGFIEIDECFHANAANSSVQSAAVNPQLPHISADSALDMTGAPCQHSR